MLNDICEVLEIKNPRDAKTRLSEKGVVTTDILTDGAEYATKKISERPHDTVEEIASWYNPAYAKTSAEMVEEVM